MSFSTLYALPDSPPTEGDGIASTTGYWNWSNAVLARGPDQFPELSHLAAHGWADRWDELEHELGELLHAVPDPTLAPITAAVLAAVRARPPEAAALLVTDGDPAADDEIDEPAGAPLPTRPA